MAKLKIGKCDDLLRKCAHIISNCIFGKCFFLILSRNHLPVLMLHQLRKRLILFLIRRHKKRIASKARLVSLHGAKSVGIIAVINSDEMFNQVLKLKNDIENHGPNVEGLVYLPAETAPKLNNVPKHFATFSDKNTNIAGIPVGREVVGFLGKEFDVLIDLTLFENLPLRYILGMSRAIIKAGLYCEDMVDIYDFMIKDDNVYDYGEYLYMMNNYLSKINIAQS